MKPEMRPESETPRSVCKTLARSRQTSTNSRLKSQEFNMTARKETKEETPQAKGWGQDEQGRFKNGPESRLRGKGRFRD